MPGKVVETTRRINNNLLKLITVSAGHFINDFYMNLLPPILFLFQKVMALSLTEQGVIAFIITSSGAFAQPVIGHFIDKKGKPWLLIISVIWIAVFMSITGLIRNYFILMLVVGIAALASAIYHPLGSAVAIRLSKSSRSRNLSIFMTIGSFAAFVAPVVALPLVNNYGLNSLVYLLIPGIIIASLMYLSKLQRVEVQLDKPEGKSKLNKINGFNTYIIKWLTVLVAIASLRVFITRSLLTYGIQYLSLQGINLNIAGIIISLYLFIRTIGIIIGGIIGDKVGEKKTFMLFNILALVSIIFIIWGSGYLMIIAFLLLGFSLSGSNTANVILAHDFVPHKINTMTGLIMGLAGGVGGLGILVFGKVADLFGLTYTMALVIIPILIINIFTLILPVKAENTAKTSEKNL